MNLEESVKMYGILTPLVVDRMRNGRYKLIDGEKRLALIPDNETVPCVVLNEPNTQNILKRLIQCPQRKN